MQQFILDSNRFITQVYGVSPERVISNGMLQEITDFFNLDIFHVLGAFLRVCLLNGPHCAHSVQNLPQKYPDAKSASATHPGSYCDINIYLSLASLLAQQIYDPLK